jgi:hypothetical protein
MKPTMKRKKMQPQPAATVAQVTESSLSRKQNGTTEGMEPPRKRQPDTAMAIKGLLQHKKNEIK